MEREILCYTYRKRRGNIMAKDDKESKHKIAILLENRQISLSLSNIIEGVIITLVATAFVACVALWLKLNDLPREVNDKTDSLSESIVGIQNSIDEINTNIDGINKNVDTINQSITAEANNRINMDAYIEEQIGQVQGQLSQFLYELAIRPTNESQKAITKGYNDWGSPYAKANASNNLKATSLVAYSSTTGTQYSAQQLSDLRLLLPYQSGGQEVYFYGAFSESGQWTGNCITNVYENDKLTLITDAEYDNGKLLKCKQIFAYTLRNGQDVWAFADRTQEDGFSSGVTWLYERTPENEYTKSFSMDEATIEHVFTGDQFREKINNRLCAFYHGNISDGFFNDETGDAYMVYFFEDGTVRLLYSGNFKDGTFNDNTGKSWYIVKEEDTDYMYAKGSFKNGNLQRSKVTEKGPPPLSLEDIKGYMAQRDFNFPFELRWAGLELI